MNDQFIYTPNVFDIARQLSEHEELRLLFEVSQVIAAEDLQVLQKTAIELSKDKISTSIKQ